jgi:hypothetical protein
LDKRIAAMSRLKIPQMYIELEVKDREGRLLGRKKVRAQSWVGNVVSLLSCILSGGTTSIDYLSLYYMISRADMVDVGGNARGLVMAIQSPGLRLGAAADAGVDAFGILAGTSSTPVTIGQYNLGAKITHGTGAGQLSYGATTVEAMVKDTTWYFRVIRAFTNNSSADITVYEVGLFVRLPYGTSSASNTVIMLARDVISGGILVPAGATLTVRYIISYSL